MSTYFESKTNSGILQITDSQPFLYLSSKNKLSSYYVDTRTLRYAINSGTYSDYSVHIYSIPVSGNLMYIGAPSSGTAHVFPSHVCYVQRTTSTSYISSLGKHNVLGIANVSKSIADNMTLYTFTQGNAPASNVGLECYDANGNRVFSSGVGVMKILTMNLFKHCTYGKEANGSYQNLNVAHTYSGKTIAFSCCFSGFYNYQASGVSDMSYENYPVCLLSSGRVQMATITRTNIYDVGYSPDSYLFCVLRECYNGGNQTAYSVVDVTNY